MYNASVVCHFGDLTEPREKILKLDGIGKAKGLSMKYNIPKYFGTWYKLLHDT